jgi:hypothetical protein
MLAATTLKPEKRILGLGPAREGGDRGVVGRDGGEEKKAHIHIPSSIMATLQEAAARLGVDLDVVITAAIWAFCRQDSATRQLLVSDFWFRDLPKLESVAGGRHTKTFKEKLHALVAYSNPFFRRRTAH